jgi:hypothetical protein
MTVNTRRTITVTARSHSRLSRLKVRYPGQVPHPAYDTALARELLAFTGELPASKHGLVALLTEYRHALYALAYPQPDTTATSTTRSRHHISPPQYRPGRRRTEPRSRKPSNPSDSSLLRGRLAQRPHTARPTAAGPRGGLVRP